MLQDLEPLRKGGFDSSPPLHKRKGSLFPDLFSTHQQRHGPTEQGHISDSGSVSHVVIIRLRQGNKVGPGSVQGPSREPSLESQREATYNIGLRFSQAAG